MRGVLTLLAAAATGVALTALVAAVRRPRRRLAGRVRPYAAAALTKLGRPVADIPVGGGTVGAAQGSALGRLLAQAVRGGGSDPVLRQRLQQAATYDVPPHLLVEEYRVRQLLAGLVGGGAGLAVGLLVGLAGLGVIGVAALGVTAGAMRPAAAVDRAIERRRRRLRAEIPPLCQLLALRLRANGSVISALAQTLHRTQGALVDELAEVLAQHRAGRPLDEALDHAAALTPEPEAARVHRLLAGCIRHGLDVAPELLRLAREARESHLTRLRRDATGRRAAILLPTIGLLAPLILLFIAAPLPGLVLGR
ncbi:hypothetical protein BH23ACT9_BH23ACT9_37790 [soil metagenome]